MSPPQATFTVEEGYIEDEDYLPASEKDRPLKHRSYILDWDQRRWFIVTGPVSLFSEDPEEPINTLKRYIKDFSASVNALLVDNGGLLLGLSSEIQTQYLHDVNYPRSELLTSFKNVPTIRLSELTEETRLKPGVDAMTQTKNPETKLVFKYVLASSQEHLMWKEMNILNSIPQHPNILPIHSLVLEDYELRVLGFATRYIPGGDMWQNRMPFKMKWLKQLTDVVDYLNLELGIIHGDVFARNLLVDPETDNLLLIDFGRAQVLSSKNSEIDPLRDVPLVILTVYELLTLDQDVRDERRIDLEGLLDIKKWPIEREVTCTEAVIKQYLRNWVRLRKLHQEKGERPPRQIEEISWGPPTDPMEGDPKKEEEDESSGNSCTGSITPKPRRHWDSTCWRRPPQGETYLESKKRKISHEDCD